MNILILHNTYQQRGGEDAVVAAESTLLRAAGHDVRVEIVSNDGISGFAAKARVFARTPFNPTIKNWLTNLITGQRPDVVHIHNFFPLLTPAVHEAATELNIPVVQTLHNYRLLCANALFLRDGQVCEKCLHGNRTAALLHRCYRGSLPGSLALVRMQNRAFRHQIWHRNVHRFIALTEFARSKFVEGGLPAENIAVKPNFVPDPQLGDTTRRGALFVGRLSKEKGVHILMKAWHSLPKIPLTVVGAGPEFERLKAMAPGNVSFTGKQPSEKVAQYLADTKALILPSICYEGFPMTVVEAFASRTPVISSNIGSLGEIIVPGRNGAHFHPGDAADLSTIVQRLFKNPATIASLGDGARASYEALYTPEKNLIQLEDIYEAALRASRNRGSI